MVRGMPLLKFDNENLCAACALGKQKKKPHKTITNSSITHPLELLHIDLCGPSTVANESEVIMEQSSTIDKSKNSLASKGIEHNFSARYTPQQNGVVERRNRTLVEAARSMLNFANLPLSFWAEAIATTCFVRPSNTTSTVKGEPSLPSSVEQVQGEPSLPAQVEEEISLPTHVDGIPQFEGGYQHSEEERNNSSADASNDAPIFTFEADEDISAEESHIQNVTPENPNFIQDISYSESDAALIPRLHKWTRNDPPNQIIGNPSSGTILDALDDDDWINAMQEELTEFQRNKVWDLVPRPANHTIIGTRWVFRNKLDDMGTVTYTPVARLEAIRIFLAYAAHKNIIVHQMDVSAFLQVDLQEVVYLQQPPGFEDLSRPNHVYRLNKVVYGLKQSPRAWEINFFLGLQIKQKSKGIFIHQEKYTNELLKKLSLENCYTAKVPISTNHKIFADQEGEPVDHKIYRGMITSLLYLTASRPDIMSSTCIYARYQAAPKLSDLTAVKQIFRYLKGTKAMGLWYPIGDNFKLQAFIDSDHAGCCVNSRSTKPEKRTLCTKEQKCHPATAIATRQHMCRNVKKNKTKEENGSNSTDRDPISTRIATRSKLCHDDIMLTKDREPMATRRDRDPIF
ncbi:hypothetical protein L2E82_23007 [Cichorium intybus]|uniref:Uncharacterized protein n=1 Tax=Cichorium intybus TaxID=13427 RepID=A0ACB9DYY2_CICIN|nr:hypothetical protein L2E82_23007 [Cichorium intybus]